MTNAAKQKGARAEREVASILTDLLGVTVRRRYNLGTHEDTGDLILNDTVVQVANYTDIVRAIREKLPETERQRLNAGATFAALFVRRRGGGYVVCMTPAMFATFYREAVL